MAHTQIPGLLLGRPQLKEPPNEDPNLLTRIILGGPCVALQSRAHPSTRLARAAPCHMGTAFIPSLLMKKQSLRDVRLVG